MIIIMKYEVFFVFSLMSVVLMLVYNVGAKDLSCKARSVPGQSVVCVCDSTYCDEIRREKPTSNYYVAYKTSKDGLRFYKEKVQLHDAYDATFPITTMTVNLSMQYQTIEGFGGSITDAAAINWMDFDSNMRDKLINSYFSDKGLEYSVLRTPIGGSDFSTRKYAFNELPECDAQLTNYTLAYEDHQYKIPMFKAAQRVATQDLKVVASTWAPPEWMKVSNGISACGKLNPDYYQTYADYHIKFIEEYEKEGIDIWGITTTNEPTNSFVTSMVFNCLGWTGADLAKWIVDNMGPSLRSSKYNKTLLFTNDDQRFVIPFLFHELIASNPDVLKYIDGVAVHGYADTIIPPSALDSVTKPYPHLKLLMTEYCTGTGAIKVQLGSWQRAEHYLGSIFQNLNYGSVGYIDWNLCLDKVGGPNWAMNFVDAPIITFPEIGEFVKQPIFYVMGHFSKFVPRGSKRVYVYVSKTGQDIGIQNVAFLTPENTVVVVIYNPSEETRVFIRLGSKAAVVFLPAASLATVEMLVEDSSFESINANVGPDGNPDNQKAAIARYPSSATDPEEKVSSPNRVSQCKPIVSSSKPNSTPNTISTKKVKVNRDGIRRGPPRRPTQRPQGPQVSGRKPR